MATPDGVVPTVDQASLAPEVNGGQEGADRIAAVLESAAELRRPIKLHRWAANPPGCQTSATVRKPRLPLELSGVLATR
ncbi:hypothetical protein SAMN05216215_103738 [Saccharopolyspora shandongensis]|uniref:Uncharacterized protein n=1 Tax=Saccharopolyspora shandongensis TaxID=418495 RepID=A0A1H3NAZ3_9PSEU|nr:hypothetical protein [Saccharopolyspora shandongensis]SDY85923.1 hypothetical protein SAMN05216215_103738 [Saccharopolyspora shandongensis]